MVGTAWGSTSPWDGSRLAEPFAGRSERVHLDRLSRKEGPQLGKSPLSMGYRPMFFLLMPEAAGDRFDLGRSLCGIRPVHDKTARLPRLALNRIHQLL